MEYKPKAFISHDSRDKERFVIDFATKLRQKGVDAWVDKWELKPGDSLPKEIFESIDESDIFISIISKHSINSNWVKEELEAGFIRKIEDKIRFIPVIIDKNIDLPPHFKHVLQFRINDLNNYDEQVKELVNNIFGISDKPSLGPTPLHVNEKPIDGFEKIDSIIFKELGNCLSKYRRGQIDFEGVCELVEKYNFSKEEISDSLEILEENGFIEFKRVCDSPYPEMNELTYRGLIIYGKNYEDNFENILKDTVSAIINDYYDNSEEISQKTNNSIVYIEALLEYFNNKCFIKISRTTDGMVIYGLNGIGRRNLRKYLD